jgi:transcription elongation factor GreB
MSKAFTSEETPDTGPVVRQPPRLAPGEVRYVTPEGAAELRAEAARARDAGQIERAALLEGTLATLTVLGPDAAPDGKVAFGTWVVVEDEEGKRFEWRIVGPDEADPKRGMVSVNAPVARALLGRTAGEAVEVARPGGEVELVVVEVRREPPVRSS